MTALLDTNLLLLYVVGLTDKRLIANHKRLQAFCADDYECVVDWLRQFDAIVTTPHVLAETSNLLRQIHSSARDRLMESFQTLFQLLGEQHIPASDTGMSAMFVPLGLTNAALLDFRFASAVLLTNDGLLHQQALALGRSAIHFNQLKD